MSMLVESEKRPFLSRLIDCYKFNSYQKRLRLTATVLRFIEICRGRMKESKGIAAQDLEKAEQC